MSTTDEAPRCASDGHRPDDDPEPGDRCKDCGREITWVGPGIYNWDLADGPELQQWVNVELTAEAAAVIAGLVAPSGEVRHDGIHAPDAVWAEIRAEFPVELFRQWAAKAKDRYYDEPEW